MRIKKTDVICGLAAQDARAFVRLLAQRRRTAERLSAVLGTAEIETTDQVLKAFEAEDYVCRQVHDNGAVEWVNTIKGNALAQATFTNPISRRKADSLLADLLARTVEYNADPTRLLAITEVRVFGSYLNPEVDKLGDLDIAIRYARRNEDSYWDDSVQQANEESRPSSISDEIMYPLKNLLQRLRQRSRFIGITVENIELFTDSWKIVYKLEDDPHAIPLTDHSVVVEASS